MLRLALTCNCMTTNLANPLNYYLFAMAVECWFVLAKEYWFVLAKEYWFVLAKEYWFVLAKEYYPLNCSLKKLLNSIVYYFIDCVYFCGCLEGLSTTVTAIFSCSLWLCGIVQVFPMWHWKLSDLNQ
jgi:hypothetical protein